VKIVLFCFVFFFFCYNTKILLQSQSSYNNNNSKTRNEILQSLPCCAQHSNSKQAAASKLQGCHESEVEEILLESPNPVKEGKAK